MIDVSRLPNCHPDEKMVYFLRRHPITLSGVFLGYLLVLLLPILSGSFLASTRPDLIQDPIIFPVIVLGGSLFFLFCWLFLFQVFLDYYLDVWVVTNQRILNITQTGLFHRQVSELRLYRVQDATASLNGFWNTFFNYGAIEIQTAGEHARFVFEDISHPQDVAKKIMQLAEIDRKTSIGDVIEELDVESEKPENRRDHHPRR
ncbi:PH domain-containing protein [Patescibacteria group bacterium]|nr:PH domain-containing protein [Patescibacteria group bacterium]